MSDKDYSDDNISNFENSFPDDNPFDAAFGTESLDGDTFGDGGFIQNAMPDIGPVTENTPGSAAPKSRRDSKWKTHPFKRNVDKKFPEGPRELYVETVFINKNQPKSFQGKTYPPKEPYSASVRFRYRLDVEGDKYNAGMFVTNLPQKKFAHEQHMNLKGLKRLLEANDMKMPSMETLKEHSQSHRPLYRTSNNIACHAVVFYNQDSKVRGYDHRPIDYVNPNKIERTKYPFNMKKHHEIESKDYFQRISKSNPQKPVSFAKSQTPFSPKAPSAKPKQMANVFNTVHQKQAANGLNNVHQKQAPVFNKSNVFAADLNQAVHTSDTHNKSQKTAIKGKSNEFTR